MRWLVVCVKERDKTERKESVNMYPSRQMCNVLFGERRTVGVGSLSEVIAR